MQAPDPPLSLAAREAYFNSFRSPINAFQSNVELHAYHHAEPHTHVRSELLFCARGLLNCQVGKCLWVVPENAALWIPAGAIHRGFGSGHAEYCAVFVDASHAARLPHEAFVIQPSVLLRELIVKSVSLDQAYQEDSAEHRLFQVMFDEIAAARRLDLVVPMPSDVRLQYMVEHLIAHPSDKTSHGEWAARLALSERSFSRIVMQQLGMTFCRWRHQLHISIAIPRIRSGETIQKVAHDLGYENSSSFIGMFKNIMRISPSRFAVITRHRRPP